MILVLIKLISYQKPGILDFMSLVKFQLTDSDIQVI